MEEGDEGPRKGVLGVVEEGRSLHETTADRAAGA